VVEVAKKRVWISNELTLWVWPSGVDLILVGQRQGYRYPPDVSDALVAAIAAESLPAILDIAFGNLPAKWIDKLPSEILEVMHLRGLVG